MTENTPPEMSSEELDEMRRRVRLVGAVALLIALGVIALSALTLKQDQVSTIPRSPVGTR